MSKTAYIPNISFGRNTLRYCVLLELYLASKSFYYLMKWKQLAYYLLKKPYLSITRAAKELKISVPAITNTVTKLIEMGILKERTGKAKNRLFVYHAYLKILAENTEPIKE